MNINATHFAIRRSLAVLALLLAAVVTSFSPGQDKKADVIVLAAEDLGQEFDKSAKATNKKYEGKALEVTGTVKMVMKIFSGPFVGLDGSKKATYGIYCETKDPQPWAKFAPGQKVKITGTYDAGPPGPQLKNCEVVALEPSPAISVTAEALAKEFAAGKDAANLKYQKKTLLVTGTVTGTEFFPGGGFYDVSMKGTDAMNVVCRLHNSQQDVGKALKAGQSLTVAGPYSYLDGKNVRVDMTFPVTKEMPK